MKIQQFFNELAEKILMNNKKITLFIGSGFSVWFGYPSWKRLFYDFCDKLTAEDVSQKEFLVENKLKVRKGYPIPKAFHNILKQLNLDTEYLKKFVIEHFKEIERVNKSKKFREDTLDFIKYKEILEICETCKIITTNFDTLIEDIFVEKFNIKPKIFYSDYSKLDKFFFGKNKNKYSILKLHGDINRKETMIIDEKDYNKIICNDEYKLVREELKHNFASNINIFVGYSIRDENIRQLLIENKDTYGEAKEKSYIINMKDLLDIHMIEEGLKEKDQSYKEIGVEEIYVSHYDELLSILRHIKKIIKVKEIRFKGISKDFRNQGITKNIIIWKNYKYALELYKMGFYLQSQRILENLVNQYGNDRRTKWEYIYSMLGVLWDCSPNKRVSERGKEYIDKAIKICQFPNEIYRYIGELYFARTMEKIYTSNTSHNLGIMTVKKSERAKKALNYFNKIKVKDNVVKYYIVDCYQKCGDVSEAIRLAEEFKKEKDYNVKIDLVLAYIFFNEANKYKYFTKDDENYRIRKTNYYKSKEMFSKFVKSNQYRMESDESKAQILNAYIQCLLELDDYIEVKKYCKELLKIEPVENNVHRYIIMIYIKEKKYDKAIEKCDYELEHTKNLGKNLLIIKYLKAQCLFVKARYTHEVIEAIKLCEEILEEREYVDVAYSIGKMYEAIGRLKEMREYIIKAYYIYPLDENLFKQAELLLSSNFQGEENEYDVQESMKKIMELNQFRNEFKKRHGSINIDRYFLYKDMDLRQENRKIKRIMIEDNIELKDFLLGKIEINISNNIKEELEEAFYYYRFKEYSKTYKIIEKYKKLFWNNHIFKYVYSNTIANINKMNEALDIYKDIIENELDYYDDHQKKLIYFYCGDCYFDREEFIKAHEHYVEAYRLDKSFSNAVFKIGLTKYNLALINRNNSCYFQLLEGAELCYKEYLRLDKYTWEAYANLAGIQMMLGKINDMTNTSIKLTGFILPPNETINNFNRILLGNLLLENEDNVKKYIDKVENFLSNIDVYKIDKQILSQYYRYKGYYYSNYSYEEAVKAFEKAYEIYPTNQNKQSLDIQKSGDKHFIKIRNKSITRGGAKPKGR